MAEFRRAIATGDLKFAPFSTYALGRVLLQLDRRDEAMAALREAAYSRRSDLVARAAYLLGRQLGLAGDFAGACTEYRRVLDYGDPWYSPRAALQLGSCLYMLGDMQGAQEAFRQAVADCDRSRTADASVLQSAFLSLGIVVQGDGDRDEARSCYEQAMAGPDAKLRGDAATRLAALVEAAGTPEALDAAQALLRSAIEDGHDRALLVLADLLGRHARWHEAEPFFRRALDAGVVGARALLGELLIRLDRLPEAEDCLRQAQAEDDDQSASVCLAMLLMRKSCRAEDLEVIRTWAIETPSYREHMLPTDGELARIVQAMCAGQCFGSLQDLLHPLEPSADLEEAERLLRRATAAGVQAGPRLLAGLLDSTGRDEEAEALYRTALAAGDERAREGLLKLLMMREMPAVLDQGSTSPEIDELLTACARSANPMVLFSVGSAYGLLGREEEASECFRAAAAAGNSTARAYMLLESLDERRREDAELLLRSLAVDGEATDFDALEGMLGMVAEGDEGRELLARLRRVRVSRGRDSDVQAFLDLLFSIT
ncbi:tetratricopeptide repeat protein [Actinospica durhamensis]|uniref:Tetratricopeptide repeat protein n=1 Tax=Actinospica durhamensis TaxID=1508375 RepID=A0A941IT52_9ACTN|nr:tetratricopeptide repeat protein [Actinospica durhamensis]MBR7839294.1 tetratricopeptide repeat protein [Actinospica durhamensis]